MELTPKQQISELVKPAKKILLLTHMDPDGDALGSILALYLILNKMGKEVIAICPMNVSTLFDFLPAFDKVKSALSGSKDFVISIDTSQTQVEKLGYQHNKEERKLNIIISTKGSNFSPEDVSFSYGLEKYDLIFVLDSPDLERLGAFYEDNAQLFYESPVINIDHHTGNEYFGKVNWVDITSTSTAEILVALLESLSREKNLLDEDIATCLLTGIITDTGSFQNQNTTPKSFTVAAQLVAAGGRQQEIIRRVFKTKKLSTLKLWGKILGNIHYEAVDRFVWSRVAKEDFTALGAEESETSGVIDELLKTVPEVDFVLLLSERRGGVHGNLRGVSAGTNVAEIARLFGGGGHEMAAAFHIPNAVLEEKETEIINRLKNRQSKTVSASPNSI